MCSESQEVCFQSPVTKSLRSAGSSPHAAAEAVQSRWAFRRLNWGRRRKQGRCWSWRWLWVCKCNEPQEWRWNRMKLRWSSKALFHFTAGGAGSGSGSACGITSLWGFSDFCDGAMRRLCDSDSPTCEVSAFQFGYSTGSQPDQLTGALKNISLTWWCEWAT